MTPSELKRCAQVSRPEVHVLANEGDVYLVQVFYDGMQALLMEGDQPKRYRSLAECSHDMANLGLRYGYMVQSMPYDEMVNSIDNVAHSDRLRIHFH
jgi:hypothetical protein